MKKYIIRVLTALTQLLNTVVFAGSPSETVSGRCYREQRLVAVRVIDTLFYFQDDHCLNAHITDRLLARAVLTPESL
tara:strand:- start:913 stop:1143 length:231 start_codon:yes stop_codon:yes gene_type:complete